MICYSITALSCHTLDASIQDLVSTYGAARAKARSMALKRLRQHIGACSDEVLLRRWVGDAVGDDNLVDVFEQRLATLSGSAGTGCGQVDANTDAMEEEDEQSYDGYCCLVSVTWQLDERNTYNIIDACVV